MHIIRRGGPGVRPSGGTASDGSARGRTGAKLAPTSLGLLPVLALLTGSAARAQAPVPNDHIANRLPLTVGHPRESRTDGCTVEWPCVDERLTGRRIDYHNDQWFSFRPPRAGQYFINIGGQQCRDVRGVQLVVLTAGEVCRPGTYTILSATSLGTQDDVFVPLTATEAGQEILLCVDGYLHDFCRFRLSLDTVAVGLPAEPAPPASTTEQTSARRVALTWRLPAALAAATGFGVYCRADNAARAERRATVPVRRNAAGAVELAYTAPDTLPAPGRYEYRIVAEGGPAPAEVRRWWVAYAPAPLRPLNGALSVPLAGFRPGATVRVVLTDAATGREVARRLVECSPGRSVLPVPVAELARQGIRRLRIRLTDPDAPGGEQVQEVEAGL